MALVVCLRCQFSKEKGRGIIVFYLPLSHHLSICAKMK